MGKSSIPYLTDNWPIVTGCTPVSAGCANCWAKRYAYRGLGDFGRHVGWDGEPTVFRQFHQVRCHPERLDQPLRWRNPRRIGVAFTGDLFHAAVPNGFTDQVFGAMICCPQHTFQVLTKRPERMQAYLSKTRGPENVLSRVIHAAQKLDKPRDWISPEGIGWPYRNISLGVSVENQATADERIPLLLQTPAAVRYISIEPMLRPVELGRYLDPLGHLDGFYREQIRKGMLNQDQLGSLRKPCLQWVIVGVESGPKRRYCDPAWMIEVVRQCKAAGVPVYCKQIHIGTPTKFRVSHDSAEWPLELRVREVPK